MEKRKVYIDCQEVGLGSELITKIKKELDIAVECINEIFIFNINDFLCIHENSSHS